MRRLPLLSLTAGAVLFAVMMIAAIANWKLPAYGLATLGLLPIAAAIGDAVRLANRSGAGQGSTHEFTTPQELDDQELREWLEDKVAAITSREQSLNAQALALQQWMQFPDAIDFDPASGPRPSEADSGRVDPMAKHDEALFALIEAKTQELFNDIREDNYRVQDGDKKTFDTRRIRGDLITLVSDVAAIYRPDETNPLLKTNVEALSRATGRAALRFLVAMESLPGGIAAYDFQSIYNIVSRAVSTYGMYKSAKPYIDVASNVLFAGRIVSSTNPVTLAAWWAAGKAATYGASKLGQHVIDQQAVGLLRQLVEIVALEVASLYSPMVRYRDVHWIYGVELVHLASELNLSPKARLEVLNQLAALSLRDEYARVSLVRQAASGNSSRPSQYEPAQSLAPAQRMTVAQRLEAFLLENVLKENTTNQAAIDRWQADTAERLEIQLRAGDIDATDEEQLECCVWSLTSFALEHLGDEPEAAIARLADTACWSRGHSQDEWTQQLRSEPPFLYHAPRIDPSSKVCEQFLTDLIALASQPRKLDDTSVELTTGTRPLIPWGGRDALQVTAYFLRTDVKAFDARYVDAKIRQLLESKEQASVAVQSPEVIDSLEVLFGGATLRCLYGAATYKDADGETQNTWVGVSGSKCVCFSLIKETGAVTVHEVADFQAVEIEKIAGYVRSDCQLRFPGGGSVIVPGSSLRGYDSYFSGLIGR